MTSKKVKIVVLLLFAVILFSGILIYENKNIELNSFKIYSEDLPSGFDGYRIAHISDLHNAQFGKNNNKLVSLLSEAKPDIIAITGDIVDSRRTNCDVSFEFVKRILEIAPCYYVTGNHEARIGEEYSSFKERMQEAGVSILDNKTITLEHAGSTIKIIGLEDPTFSVSGTTEMEAEVVADNLRKLTDTEKKFTLLLSHKPEFFDVYVENNIDLVLSGHTHAGQFVIPFIGGFIAPGQGFFPEYDSGLFKDGSTSMIISRGIGNSIFPLRVNNRPEIILIELYSN